MDESLNALADHRATFLGWWKASMREAIALRARHTAETEKERSEAAGELRAAALAKVHQLNAIHGQLRSYAGRVLETAQRLRSG